MKPYTPLDWYWVVGGDTTKAYSSKLGYYVQTSDPVYTNWVADGTMPTRMDTEANLGQVLSPYYPDITRPAPVEILNGYQQEQANDIFRHKLIKYLFVLHNDVRVLKGLQPHTIAQARAYFRGLM